jgi:gliotoxin/aspirochlorine biosynthesis gamma-glutamylcyclotransferase
LKTIQATAPGYILRFDLPGIPYQEPAFSSIRRRIREEDPDVIGIAYLLTRDEYERLLLSEGGRDGGYTEIDVSVKPLLDLTDEKSSIMCKSLGTREPRENPYPQPSARYISLIQTGAAEHKFPAKYRKYLESLPIYRISSLKTEIGRILFLLMWLPLVVFIFIVTGRYKNGNVPKWLKKLQRWAFTTMWIVHDRFFARIFGRGDVASEEKPSLRYAIVE